MTHRLNHDLKVGDWVYNHGFAHAAHRHPGVVYRINPHTPATGWRDAGFDEVLFVIPGRGTSMGARRNFTIIPPELVAKVPQMADEDVWAYINTRSEYNRIATQINEAKACINTGSRMDPIPLEWFEALHAAADRMQAIHDPKETA